VLHPAVEVVIAIKPASIGSSANHFCESAEIAIAATDVNTSSATVFGFVTSM
jgi:hypothetical protein